MNKSGLKQYKRTETEGASPAQILSLLLEKCAKETEKAKECIQNQEIEKIMDHCQKVSTILTGLSNSLLRETPEQQAMTEVLTDYYRMLMQLLNQIVCRQDLSSCDALISSVREMAEAWRQGERGFTEALPEDIAAINVGV